MKLHSVWEKLSLLMDFIIIIVAGFSLVFYVMYV